MRFALVIWSFFLAVTGALAQPGIWSDIFDVSRNNFTSAQPDIVIDDQDNIHLIWIDNSRLGGGGNANMDVLYSYFNGQTWSASQQLSAMAATCSWRPRITVDDLQRPHAAWSDDVFYYEGYYAKILYSLRPDSAWSLPLILSEGAQFNWRPQIIVDTSNQVQVFWDGSFSGYHHILRRVFDGMQWGPIEDVTPNSGLCWDARVRVDSQNRLHMVWINGEGYTCYLTYSHNDGQGWSPPQPLPAVVGMGMTTPDLALDENGYPHVVWLQSLYGPHPYQIYYSYFNGSSWSTPQDITDLGGDYFYPRIAIAPGKVFVTFSRDGGSGYQNYLHYSYLQGDNWAVPDTLFPSCGGSTAAISFDSDHHLHSLICCWYGMSYNSEILQICYLDSALIPANLTPHTLPILIPPSGGSFNFDVRIENHAVLPVTFDAWIEAVLPNGSTYGPILLRQNLNLASNGVLFRPNLLQYVPGGAPAGEYIYRLRAGDYSDSIIVSSDSFSFVKEGINVSAGGEWLLEGWEEGPLREERSQPSSMMLLEVSPNPCNATTVISFELRAASYVSLRVYDTAGRIVVTLADGQREAGAHQITFDGSGLPSGIYLAQLEAGGETTIEKVVMMK